MSNHSARNIRILSVIGVAGILALSTGCQSSKKVSEAQSPPPTSISAPVRVEETAAKPQPANVTVVPSEEYAFLQDRKAPASKPLPSVTPPAPELAPAPAIAPAPETPRYYTMKKGDTLYAIARKYNIPPKQLIAANNFPNPNVLPVGTKVRLP